MTLTIHLSWTNRSHPLLRNGTIGLLLGNRPLKARSLPNGVKEYVIENDDIHPGAASLLLKGGFTHYVNNQVRLKDWLTDPPSYVGTAEPMSSRVLDIRQRYSFKSTTDIEPVFESPFVGSHPLVTTSYTQKYVLITIDTNFVDVTPFWEKYAVGWNDFVREKPPSIDFKALAYTGDAQNDWIWLASVPSSCKTASDIGVLVHFPYPVTNYTRIGETQDMWYPNRHLLAPDPNAPPSDSVRRLRFSSGMDNWGFVKRAGFLKSLLDSGKPVALFYLSPKISGFGPASQKSLSKMVLSALRLLHGLRLVGVGKAKVSRKRFGISVYSGGGYSAISALLANRAVVDEFYAMDATGLTKEGPTRLKRWFEERARIGTNPCLRLTGWYQRKVNRTLFNQCSTIKGGSVSISPPANIGFEDFYMQTTNPGQPQGNGSAWWNECLREFSGKDLDDARKNVFARHQFALQGGPVKHTKGHYMLHFLNSSGF